MPQTKGLFYVCANFLRAINVSCPFVFVVTVYVLMSNIRHFFSKLIAWHITQYCFMIALLHCPGVKEGLYKTTHRYDLDNSFFERQGTKGGFPLSRSFYVRKWNRANVEPRSTLRLSAPFICASKIYVRTHQPSPIGVLDAVNPGLYRENPRGPGSGNLTHLFRLC